MIAIDGHAIESLRMTHALGTHWTMRVQCERYTPATSVTIDDGETQWIGRPAFVQEVGDSVSLTVTGGLGDWDADVPPVHWPAPTTVGAVAIELAQSAGQRAESSVVVLPSWRHSRSRLASALSLLARWGGVQWYQRPDGVIAFDTPAGAALTDPIRDDGETLVYDAGGRLPLVLSASVGRAMYTYGLGAKEWTITTWPASNARAVPRSEWQGAVIESQSDGLVDLRLDDGSLRSGVPLWSMPGVRAKVPNDTRCLAYDVGGDPRATIAFASQWDASVDSLDLADAHAYPLRSGDLMMVVDEPPPLGAIPPAFSTAGITPDKLFRIMLAPPALAVAGAPLPFGRSKVKL